MIVNVKGSRQKHTYHANFVFSVQNETPEFKSILTFVRFQ